MTARVSSRRPGVSKGVSHQGNKAVQYQGKLSPRYIGPCEIIEKLYPVAYRLNLPIELGYEHNVFHISQLWKYVPDPNHIIEAKPIEVVKNLAYEEYPAQILDRRVKQLRNKSIPLAKILWANHTSSEAT